MAVLVTLVIQLPAEHPLHIWQAERLAAQVYEAGASRLHVYRNSQAAAEILLAAEAPTPAAAHALGRMLAEALRPLAGPAGPQARVWELMRGEGGA